MSSLHRAFGLVAAFALTCASSVSANGFFIEPEAVFLKFHENDFDFAIEGETGVIEDGDTVSVDSDYEAGFRIGLGYSWEGWWDITVRHTHVDDRSYRSASDARGALWGPTVHPTESFFGSDAFTHVDAELDIDLDYTDVEAGKRWNHDNGGSLRLFFGLRFSHFDQDAKAVHRESVTAWETTETHLDFSGWGPLVGLTGRLPLGQESGWSVFGTIAGSLQFGDVDGRYVNSHVADSTMSEMAVIDFDYDDQENTTVSVIEGRVGFGWEHAFERVTFSLRFGYEYQIWNDLATTNSLIADALGQPFGGAGVTSAGASPSSSHGGLPPGSEPLRADEDISVHGFFFGLGWTW